MSTAHKTKIGFVSLGCPKNLVDSEGMMALLARTFTRRQHHLMIVQKKIVREKNRRRVGQHLGARVDGPSKEIELLWEARLESQAPEIDSKVYLNDVAEPLARALRPGSFVEVEITEAREYDPIGRVTALA